MSEKELRRKAIYKNKRGLCTCTLCGSWSATGEDCIDHTRECPLAQDPDAVAMLRWLRDNIKWDPVYRTTYRGTYAWIQETFHIRLTGDVEWEYTDA